VKAGEGKRITRGFSEGRKSSVLAGKPEPHGKRSEGRETCGGGECKEGEKI